MIFLGNKILAKILICSCFVEKFHSEDNEYAKKLCHFKCKCNDSHIIYILSCNEHPYVAAKIPEMDPGCNCLPIDALEIFNYCRQVRYLLNFRAYKLCLKKIPKSIQDKIVTTHQFFKSMPGCQPFFAFSKELGRIDIYLDNPRESYYIKEADC